eukprot:6480264-Amphidinium_carterae.2
MSAFVPALAERLGRERTCVVRPLWSLWPMGVPPEIRSFLPISALCACGSAGCLLVMVPGCLLWTNTLRPGRDRGPICNLRSMAELGP